PGVRGDGEGGCVKVTGGGFGGDGLNDNLMVTNNSFLQNSAATDAGALHIGMGNHNPTVTGNTFRENTTTGNAGALHIQDGVTHFTVSANTFERNLTGLKGGAMEIHGGVSTCTNASVISGNTFTANSALRAGGAIRTRNDAPCLTLTGNTYTNNTAARAGGAVQFGADFGSPSNNALFQNETFSGNSSASGSSCRDGGGAIHFRGSVPNLTIVGSSFTGNSSFKGGGAIDFDTGCDFSNEVLQPAVTIQNTLFLTNSAQGPGGAVEFDHHMDTLLIQNVLFQGNSSTNDAGGAIAFNNNICCSFTTTSTGVQILS